MYLVLAVNPVLAAWGQFAAIVICFYILVFVLLAVVFNVAMTFALFWVREKANLVKMLRPTVDSVNKTTEAAVKGVPPPESENKIVRAVAEGPARVHTLDKQVEQGSDRVMNAVIEFRARTVQAQEIVKSFFLPGLTKRIAQPLHTVSDTGLEFKSPGYRMLMEEKVPSPETAVVPAPTPGDGYVQTVTVSQLRDAPTR